MSANLCCGHAACQREVRQAQAEVADAFVRWGMKNEVAEPPLDWAWFGEIARRYSPLHAGHEPEDGRDDG